MTVTTVYSSTTDGYVDSYSTVSYAVAKAGTGSFAVDNSGTLALIGQYYDGVSKYECIHDYVSFDTSSINDADTVTIATLSIWAIYGAPPTAHTLRARTYDWGNTLTSGDWQTPSQAAANTLLATFASASTVAGAYCVFTSEAALLTATGMKTGTVYMIVVSSRFESETTPTGGSEYNVYSSSDESGTTQDPKLVITHSLSFTGTAAPSFPFLDAAASGTVTITSASGTIAATFPFMTASASGTRVNPLGPVQITGGALVRPNPRLILE